MWPEQLFQVKRASWLSCCLMCKQSSHVSSTKRKDMTQHPLRQHQDILLLKKQETSTVADNEAFTSYVFLFSNVAIH